MGEFYISKMMYSLTDEEIKLLGGGGFSYELLKIIFLVRYTGNFTVVYKVDMSHTKAYKNMYRYQ